MSSRVVDIHSAHTAQNPPNKPTKTNIINALPTIQRPTCLLRVVRIESTQASSSEIPVVHLEVIDPAALQQIIRIKDHQVQDSQVADSNLVTILGNRQQTLWQ